MSWFGPDPIPVEIIDPGEPGGCLGCLGTIVLVAIMAGLGFPFGEVIKALLYVAWTLFCVMLYLVWNLLWATIMCWGPVVLVVLLAVMALKKKF